MRCFRRFSILLVRWPYQRRYKHLLFPSNLIRESSSPTIYQKTELKKNRLLCIISRYIQTLQNSAYRCTYFPEEFRCVFSLLLYSYLFDPPVYAFVVVELYSRIFQLQLIFIWTLESCHRVTDFFIDSCVAFLISFRWRQVTSCHSLISAAVDSLSRGSPCQCFDGNIYYLHVDWISSSKVLPIPITSGKFFIILPWEILIDFIPIKGGNWSSPYVISDQVAFPFRWTLCFEITSHISLAFYKLCSETMSRFHFCYVL